MSVLKISTVLIWFDMALNANLPHERLSLYSKGSNLEASAGGGKGGLQT